MQANDVKEETEDENKNKNKSLPDVTYSDEVDNFEFEKLDDDDEQVRRSEQKLTIFELNEKIREYVIDYRKNLKSGREDLAENAKMKMSILLLEVVHRKWENRMDDLKSRIFEPSFYAVGIEYEAKAFEDLFDLLLDETKENAYQPDDSKLPAGVKSNLNSYVNRQIFWKIGNLTKAVFGESDEQKQKRKKRVEEKNKNKIRKRKPYKKHKPPFHQPTIYAMDDNRDFDRHEVVPSQNLNEFEQTEFIMMFLKIGYEYCSDNCDREILEQIVASIEPGSGLRTGKIDVNYIQGKYNISAPAITQRKNKLIAAMKPKLEVYIGTKEVED